MMGITGIETLAAADAPAAATSSGRQLQTGGFSVTQSLSGTTQPAVEDAPLVQQVTISGTTTIDFTSAPQQAGRTGDMTGLKVVAAIFKPAADNIGAINIAPGAANPYPLFGTANDIDLAPGQMIVIGTLAGIDANLPSVSSSVKTIDITGTATDTMDVEIHFGT